MQSIVRKALALAALITALSSCGNNQTSETTESKSDTSTSQRSGVPMDTSSKNAGLDNMKMDNGLMGSMKSMIEKMQGMKMTGDFDHDFASMMIEHHQGAIDMSELELKSGTDDKMKSMAQKIISMQKEEIGQLKNFTSSHKPFSMKTGEGEMEKSMQAMKSKMSSMHMSGNMDKDFAMMMTQHHQDAISMSKQELANGMDAKMKKMAQKGIDESNKDIKELQDWMNSHK